MSAPNSDYGAISRATTTSSAPAPAEPLIGPRLRNDEHNLFICWVIITRARGTNPALCHGIVGELFLNPYERRLFSTITPEQHERFTGYAMMLENLATLRSLANRGKESEKIRNVLEWERDDVMGA